MGAKKKHVSWSKFKHTHLICTQPTLLWLLLQQAENVTAKRSFLSNSPSVQYVTLCCKGRVRPVFITARESEIRSAPGSSHDQSIRL